jgi:hypothetical protein
VNTKQVFGLSNSDLVPGKYEGDDVLLIAFLSMKHTHQTAHKHGHRTQH